MAGILLERALGIVLEHGPQPVKVGTWEATESALRDGLETTYRTLGREAASRDERVEWILRANQVRNWSLT